MEMRSHNGQITKLKKIIERITEQYIYDGLLHFKKETPK